MTGKQRKIVLAIMWSAAIAAALFIAAGQAGDPYPRAGSGDEGVVRTPRDLAPEDSRLMLSVSAERVGPPQSFRGGRRHTGQSSLLGPVSAERLWSFEAAGRISGQTVIDSGGRVIFGAHDGWLYVLNESGVLDWKRDLGGPIYATPLVLDDGRIFVGCDADIYWAFSPDGEVLWRLETPGDADTGTVQSSDGTLYFGAGPELWAVNVDGVVQWRFRARQKIYSTPAIDEDGTIYVGSQDDFFYALAPDGRVRWSYRTRDDNDASPFIGPDGTIYFGSDDHHVYALDRDGELKWRADLEGYVRAPLALGADGLILAATFGPRPRLVALRPDSGEVAWYFPVTVADSAQLGIMSGPLVDADGAIYFGAHDDYLYSLNHRGELRFAFATSGDVAAPPVLAAPGRLIVGSGDGHLYAIVSAAAEELSAGGVGSVVSDDLRDAVVDVADAQAVD